VGDSSLESKLFTAVTGIEMTEEQSLELGDMLFTLERAIQAREGRTREDDVLREICFTNTDAAGRQYHEADLERAKDEHYALQGWDERGIPTTKKLRDVGLADVAKELEEAGIIPSAGEAGRGG
jgi:aldehyde:ferredoxin oxidoreductase